MARYCSCLKNFPAFLIHFSNFFEDRIDISGPFYFLHGNFTPMENLTIYGDLQYSIERLVVNHRIFILRL